ncbi:hypothetical protein AB6A40_010083 [Gnathostoma spinigerum]|uniref:Uncharacterized protein n=1 Tax=Gnathostoma spinigerum TaxID=75299 RepID=A0ABD6F0U5_9BILA
MGSDTRNEGVEGGWAFMSLKYPTKFYSTMSNDCPIINNQHGDCRRSTVSSCKKKEFLLKGYKTVICGDTKRLQSHFTFCGLSFIRTPSDSGRISGKALFSGNEHIESSVSHGRTFEGYTEEIQ